MAPVTDDNGSAAEKTPVDQAMDVLVYAPIGLLFEGATILPQLVDKGRSQVTMARMVGKFAVQQGRTEAMKTASKLSDQAARSEEHTSELQSLMRISYAVFCLKNNKNQKRT